MDGRIENLLCQTDRYPGRRFGVAGAAGVCTSVHRADAVSDLFPTAGVISVGRTFEHGRAICVQTADDVPETSVSDTDAVSFHGSRGGAAGSLAVPRAVSLRQEKIPCRRSLNVGRQSAAGKSYECYEYYEYYECYFSSAARTRPYKRIAALHDARQRPVKAA